MKNIQEKGFTLIEILIAIALVAVIFPAVVMLLTFSVTEASQGEKYSRANTLAQEQMEAIYKLKDSKSTNWDWEVTPANTANGEFYQPAIVSGNWQLGAKTSVPVTLEGFTKTVEIGEVRRCDSDICDLGTLDPYTRKIKVAVSWEDKGETQTAILESIVTMY